MATGEVADDLRELSGIAASRRHPGIYWAHNDSGNAFVLYAIRESGEIAARFPLRGARPRDIEDIAVGPCAKGSAQTCVYLGDIGDNLARRDRAWIYKIPEPPELDGRTIDVQAFSFRYPDGARDAESLLVEPGTGRLFVVSKTITSLGDVYRLDGLRSREVGRAVHVTTLPAVGGLGRLVTGGDAHPSGESVLLRSYTTAWELRRPGAKRLEDVFQAAPIEVTGASQVQGEGVAYTLNGRGYLLAGEGAGRKIYRVDCNEGAPPPRSTRRSRAEAHSPAR